MKKYSRTSLLQSVKTKFLCIYFSKMWFFFNLLFLQPWYKGAIIFFRRGGGGAWKSWGSQNFFMRNRGVTKKSRDYWVATNFNENFVQWNSPKMHIFCATRIGGYIYIQHCSSGWGVIKFLIIKWGGGPQKYCRGTFGNLWPPPRSRENGGPLTKFGYNKLISLSHGTLV